MGPPDFPPYIAFHKEIDTSISILVTPDYPLLGGKEDMTNHISTSFNLIFYFKNTDYHFVLNNSVFYNVIFFAVVIIMIDQFSILFLFLSIKFHWFLTMNFFY